MKPIHLMKYSLALALAATCGKVQSKRTALGTKKDFQVGRFLDQDSEQLCREKLMEADLDQNSLLDSEEYAYYLKLASDGRIDSQFEDLGAMYILIFCTVACDTCFKVTGDQGCCVGSRANIPLNNTDSVDFLLSLDFVCTNVEQALANDISRSPLPSPPAQVSGKPTIMPTHGFPTISPFASITGAPVPLSESPTLLPVVRMPTTWPPVMAPVQYGPSPAPVVVSPPTASPSTKLPVVAPSITTTAPNTNSPTIRVPSSVSPASTRPHGYSATSSPESRGPPSSAFVPSISPSPTTWSPITAVPSESLAPLTTSPFTFEPTIDTSAPTATGAPFTFEPTLTFEPTFETTAPFMTSSPFTFEPTMETSSPVTTSSPYTAEPAVATSSPVSTSGPSVAQPIAHIPTTTSLPSSTINPIVPVPAPTPAFSAPPVCITFSYTLQNQVGLTADDLFYERNNTVKESLASATRAAIIEILNVSMSQPNETTHDTAPGATPENQDVRPRHFNHTRVGSGFAPTDSPSTPHLRVKGAQRKMLEIHSDSFDSYLSALERALELFSNSTNRQLCTIRGETSAVLNENYVRRMKDFASRVESRRLAYYSDSLPVKITSIIDYPQCDTRGNAKVKCALVSSKACVVLERGDDRQVIRTMLRDGLKDAVNSGAIDPAYPSS